MGRSMFKTPSLTSLTIVNSNITQIGTHVQVDCRIQPFDGIDILLKHTALGAPYDSSERFDAPRCHPKTRVLVLDEIEAWARGEASTKPIMWLSGPAGAGKSAIAQTLSERWAQRGILGASFFFSRNAVGCNEKKHFIPTIVYHLATSIPLLRPHIRDAIAKDPTIFTKSLKSQFEKLVIGPFLLIPSTLLKDRLIVIDGLDECSLDYEAQHHEAQQREILEAIALISQHKIPVRFLIVSRPERQIRESFQDAPLKPYTSIVPLDDSFNPAQDIRFFLRSSFEIIKKQRGNLPDPWPSDRIINHLVEKSSGQFIYAATAVRYVGSPHGDPISKLEIILGLRRQHDSSSSPFEELDALYTHILESVPKTSLDTVLCILESLSFIIREWSWSHINPFPSFHPYSPAFLEKLLFVRQGMVYTHLTNLHSILEIPPPENAAKLPIRFIHASFSDYLTDKTRSGQFFISKSQARLRCQMTLLNHIFVTSSKLHHDATYDGDGVVKAFVWALWFDSDSPLCQPSLELKKGLEAALRKNDDEYFAYLRRVGLEFLGRERKLRLQNRLAPYQRRWVLRCLQRCNVKELEPSWIHRLLVAIKLKKQISWLPEAEYTDLHGWALM